MSFSIGALLGTREETLLYQGFERKMKFCLSEGLIFGESKRYVKQGSGKGKLSP